MDWDIREAERQSSGPFHDPEMPGELIQAANQLTSIHQLCQAFAEYFIALEFG
jgi:hypothetical protein